MTHWLNNAHGMKSQPHDTHLHLRLSSMMISTRASMGWIIATHRRGQWSIPEWSLHIWTTDQSTKHASSRKPGHQHTLKSKGIWERWEICVFETANKRKCECTVRSTDGNNELNLLDRCSASRREEIRRKFRCSPMHRRIIWLAVSVNGLRSLNRSRYHHRKQRVN